METLMLRGGRARGWAELPLEGKADANPAGTPGSAAATFALVDWLSPVLSQPGSLEQARQAGVPHTCLKFSASIISVTDLVFFFLVIYVQI